MNNVTPDENKQPKFSKPVAVAGFVAIIGLIAWISVQLVSLAPSAFNSLASLSQGISNYRETMSADNDSPLAVASDLKLVNVGESVTIAWNKDSREGAYAFSYKCLDGVSIDIVDTEGLRSIACDTRYSLGMTESVTIVIDSEKNRHVDIPYTISFMRSNDTGPVRSGDNTLTITNENIEDTLAVLDTPAGEVLGENDAKEEVPVAPVKPTLKPVVIAEPVTEYIYEIPVSNPNGFTDLATRFLNVGDINDNKFVAGSIARDDSGAFQFEVKNIGTKTSEPWSYTLTLPDGDTYTSPKQAALKPNERAVISLGFDTPDKASHTLVVVVKVEDKIDSNNSFKKVVNFSK
jgi:hypothetical protein